ncbi:MAG: tagaturonate epimerase family protein, partial [Bacteroidota bacterium]
MFIRDEIAHEFLLLAEAMVGEGITRRDALPASFRREKVVPYRTSWRRYAGGALFLAHTPDEKVLVTIGEGDPPFYGEVLSAGGCRLGVHPMSGANAAVLRQLMPFTAPAKLPPAMPSFGCGDRLGLANPGHLQALGNYRVALVLAQQSIRELNLTGRCFGEVIDAATWAVLQEGYERGFGADGDHLKNLEEVRLMLAAGAT